MAAANRTSSSFSSQITSYLPKTPDPFLTSRIVDDVVSYPRSNDDITFVVDDSNRCDHVQAALLDASNVFAYKGAMEEPDELWEPSNWMPLFDGALSEEEQQQVRTILEQKQLPVNALLKVASPAPFGRNGASVFDPEYRKAFEIPRRRLPSNLLEVLDLNFMMEKMETAMKPVSKNWNYQLYKIHMYGPGGKFEDHVDTLHANNHVATVVLSLPSEHVGGILRVRHNGKVLEFDSAKGPKKNKYDETCLRYGAFFTDCTHSVQEVISGWRVVVQYDVYEEGNNNESVYEDIYSAVNHIVHMRSGIRRSAGAANILNTEQTELVRAVLQYLAKLHPADGVAFFLRHRYSLPALDEVVLKGTDRIIYDAFSKRGDLSISFRGVLVYFRIEDGDEVSVNVRAVSPKDFLPTNDGGGDCDGEDDEEQSIDSDADSNVATEGITTLVKEVEKTTVHLIVDKNNGAMRVHDTEEMGNEPADGYNTYFVACMIIRCKGKPAQR
jgi:hypothetical protein